MIDPVMILRALDGASENRQAVRAKYAYPGPQRIHPVKAPATPRCRYCGTTSRSRRCPSCGAPR